ncbi:MAG: hypothetical protein ACOYU3_02465 [Bacillota bacterium]
MSKGFCTALKVMGIVCGSIVAIIGIYLMITMISSISGIFNYSSSYYSGMSMMIVLYVFLGIYIIIDGFVLFAVLFFLGSAGNYMRLKLQKDGVWGLPNLYAAPSPYYGYQPPQAQPQSQAPTQPQPESGGPGEDNQDTSS